jgi:hypothetical protein
MKRMSVFLFFAIVLFTSCKKDILHNHPDAILNCCRVEKLIMFAAHAPTTDTLTFHYNQWDNPVYAERITTGDLSYLNYVFKYDSRNRLSDFIGIYNTLGEFDGISYEFWHRYAYDNQDRIIADTNYIPSWDEYPPPGPGQVIQYTDSIEYDAKNRIVREVSRDVLFGPVVTYHVHYNYNSNNNLESKIRYITGGYDPGASGYDTISYTNYDNKVNLRRTNKLWMVIDRNYSLNNPYQALGYNNVGLPLKNNVDFLWQYTNILMGYPANEIQYRCK